MFETLTDRLHEALRKLRGVASLSENNISDAMQDVRTALIDADVNREIADEFVEEVRRACLGEAVLKSITPGQMAIKIVNDKLTEFMGTSEAEIVHDPANKPNVVMVVGLHGGGKTTTCAKIALNFKKKGWKTLLTACDIYRPAAIDQLEILADQTGSGFYAERNNSDVCAIAMSAISKAVCENDDYVIVDTAGRLQIDEPMVQELVRLKKAIRPSEILLVADAALGQQAVSVARHFHEALGITGIILTKLDGDARGGAALSIRKVTNCPIKFVGTGEKLEELEVFHPDRMASRILGMGDIVSLVEKAAEDLDKEDARKLQERLKKNEFDFDDFLAQLKQMRRMGGLASIMKMLPGGSSLSLDGGQEDEFRRMEAIICSMNKKERANPDLIDMSRRKRIAKGSGTDVVQVSHMIKQFTNLRKMMKQSGIFSKLMSGANLDRDATGADLASMPLPGMSGLTRGFRPSFPARGSNYTPPKKKRKKH